MNISTGHCKSKKRIIRSLVMTVFVMLLAGLSGTWAEEDTGKTASLQESLVESLQLEKDLLTDLKQDRDRIRQLEPAMTVELEAYQILLSTCANMLAQLRPDPENMKQAGTGVKAANIRIRERLKTLNKQFDTFKPLKNGLNEQLAINTTYLEEIRNIPKKNRSAEKTATIKSLQALLDVIHQKQQCLEEIHHFYQLWITKLEITQENLASISTRLETGIHQSRKGSHLIRRTTLLSSGNRENLVKEADNFFGQLEQLLSIKNIKSEAELMWKSARTFMAMPILLFFLVIMLAFQLQRYHMKILKNQVLENCPAFRLTWRVFNHSFLVLLITASLFIYTQIKALYAPVHVDILLSLLQVFLFTKWGLDIISGIDQMSGIKLAAAFQKRIRVLLILVRFYLTTYVFLDHLLPADSILSAWGRLIFASLLIVWCLEFWKTERRQPLTTNVPQNGIFKNEVLKLSSYLISFGGLVFEIAGYGSMSFFWYASWGRTLIIGLWAALLYISLRELSIIFQVNPDQDKDLPEASGAPITWLFLKLGQPVVLVLFLMGVILAWGGKRGFLVGLLETLQHTYRVGSMELSIIGFLYALIGLLITHIVAQTWRHVFQQKLLARSGMVVGLQESVTTISVYVLWGLGVLIALNFIGLNTTTLTVAFGALGIGIGFGLQNIFNNFVSGIILLLERPIQVGDDIQVNDSWATVKKINVRSTIVQTYDNATLIIPNSDLISNQVTNWSFKDKRLRRNILVGVAYGSDIELVRKTLLEAAGSTPRVLKQPKPEVLFKDFGDSALVFNLRIWTNIAYFMSVETDVRFTIDRLFRENKITIAFPQRDVHVFHENPPGSFTK